MDCDGLLSDELDVLEDRQDLSQYSYDPEDRLDTVTFPESQQSSQASDKTDVFLGVVDDYQSADDFDGEDLLACLNDHNEFRPVMSEETTNHDLAGWLAVPVAKESSPVSTCHDVLSELWENACRQQTFEIQVLRTGDT